jgi:hypothetical protein
MLLATNTIARQSPLAVQRRIIAATKAARATWTRKRSRARCTEQLTVRWPTQNTPPVGAVKLVHESHLRPAIPHANTATTSTTWRGIILVTRANVGAETQCLARKTTLPSGSCRVTRDVNHTSTTSIARRGIISTKLRTTRYPAATKAAPAAFTRNHSCARCSRQTTPCVGVNQVRGVSHSGSCANSATYVALYLTPPPFP